jgi:hypothetical protein
MLENCLSGSEGGGAIALPTPIIFVVVLFRLTLLRINCRLRRAPGKFCRIRDRARSGTGTKLAEGMARLAADK